MDDPQNIPQAAPPEGASQRESRLELDPDARPEIKADEGVAPAGAQPDPQPVLELQTELLPAYAPTWAEPPANLACQDSMVRQRNFRQNLLLLLSLSLAAFILTAWVLVRVDLPFGMFSTGPQEVARAQLRALDRGELRPAYDMFSPRYRQQVSFDVWHQLITTHWRIFHAEVLRAGSSAQTGPRATLEMYLRGADDKTYRARFTLIRQDGRWWIDDVHWTEEGRDRDFIRS